MELRAITREDIDRILKTGIITKDMQGKIGYMITNINLKGLDDAELSRLDEFAFIIAEIYLRQSLRLSVKGRVN